MGVTNRASTKSSGHEVEGSVKSSSRSKRFEQLREFLSMCIDGSSCLHKHWAGGRRMKGLLVLGQISSFTPRGSDLLMLLPPVVINYLFFTHYMLVERPAARATIRVKGSWPVRSHDSYSPRSRLQWGARHLYAEPYSDNIFPCAVQLRKDLNITGNAK